MQRVHHHLLDVRGPSSTITKVGDIDKVRQVDRSAVCFWGLIY